MRRTTAAGRTQWEEALRSSLGGRGIGTIGCLKWQVLSTTPKERTPPPHCTSDGAVSRCADIHTQTYLLTYLRVNALYSQLSGAWQGTRPGGAEEFYISHVREELDTPNEFFLDRRTAKLLYMPNVTTATAAAGESAAVPPPSEGFVLTRLRTLLSINGTKQHSVKDVTIQGVGFRDARATYMDDHGVPSGGDWALQRSGAVFLDGTEGVRIANVTMERNDGNAIMISGHNTRTSIVSNEIRYTGDSAIALWGRTDEMSNGGLDGMYADGDHPDGVEIAHNLVPPT